MARNPTGGNTSTIITDPRRRKRKQKAMRRQESRWAAKAGPVTVTYVEPRVDQPDGQRPQPSPGADRTLSALDDRSAANEQPSASNRADTSSSQSAARTVPEHQRPKPVDWRHEVLGRKPLTDAQKQAAQRRANGLD